MSNVVAFPMNVRGSIPSIVRNDNELYEGDLKHYFRAVFHFARNANNPYHNLRHILHMLWLCHDACLLHKNLYLMPERWTAGKDALSPRNTRNLFIAALFHDFDHTGEPGTDDKNIANAVAGLAKHIAEEDKSYQRDIVCLIEATQYPYVIPDESLDIRGKIIRDADLVQALDVAWIQQVVIGLASEWKKPPMQVLGMQPGFLSNLKFRTKWAESRFPPEAIREKIAEAKELVEILNHPGD